METTSDKPLDSGKTLPVRTPESGSTTNNGPTVNFFAVDLILRFLVFASALVAAVVMSTSKETKLIRLPVVPFPTVPLSAKFSDSPAFIYFVVAVSIAGLYALLTLTHSVIGSRKPSPSTKLLFLLALYDSLMTAIMASATGAAASIAYVGLKGNSHVQWNKVCHMYSKFCRHVGSSIAVSLFGTIVLLLLVFLSTYSLYKRSR